MARATAAISRGRLTARWWTPAAAPAVHARQTFGGTRFHTPLTCGRVEPARVGSQDQTVRPGAIHRSASKISRIRGDEFGGGGRSDPLSGAIPYQGRAEEVSRSCRGGVGAVRRYRGRARGGVGAVGRCRG